MLSTPTVVEPVRTRLYDNGPIRRRLLRIPDRIPVHKSVAALWDADQKYLIKALTYFTHPATYGHRSSCSSSHRRNQASRPAI